MTAMLLSCPAFIITKSGHFMCGWCVPPCEKTCQHSLVLV